MCDKKQASDPNTSWYTDINDRKSTHYQYLKETYLVYSSCSLTRECNKLYSSNNGFCFFGFSGCFKNSSPDIITTKTTLNTSPIIVIHQFPSKNGFTEFQPILKFKKLKNPMINPHVILSLRSGYFLSKTNSLFLYLQNANNYKYLQRLKWRDLQQKYSAILHAELPRWNSNYSIIRFPPMRTIMVFESNLSVSKKKFAVLWFQNTPINPQTSLSGQFFKFTIFKDSCALFLDNCFHHFRNVSLKLAMQKWYTQGTKKSNKHNQEVLNWCDFKLKW